MFAEVRLMQPVWWCPNLAAIARRCRRHALSSCAIQEVCSLALMTLPLGSLAAQRDIRHKLQDRLGT